MLVLSRKKHESIEIGDDVRLVVVEIRGDKVRLGFEAPPEVKILRSELPPDAFGGAGREPRAGTDAPPPTRVPPAGEASWEN